MREAHRCLRRETHPDEQDEGVPAHEEEEAQADDAALPAQVGKRAGEAQHAGAQHGRDVVVGGCSSASTHIKDLVVLSQRPAGDHGVLAAGEARARLGGGGTAVCWLALVCAASTRLDRARHRSPAA